MRVLAVAAGAFVLLLAAPALAGTTQPAGVSAARAGLSWRPALGGAILSRLNAVRAARGLGRLRLSSELAAAARLHSRQMATTGRFQHESSDGSPFWRRVERYYASAGFRTWNVGETLLWWSPGTTAANVVAAWLASPEHRRILLDPRWRQVGVGVVHDSYARGAFYDQPATIVTADFGFRAA